jgi:hypothetical protein
MKKCILFVLLILFLLSACTPNSHHAGEDETSAGDPTKSLGTTQPHGHDDTTEPTEPTVPDEPWYFKIKQSRDFDEWSVKVTEWNRAFYYITEDGLYRWDPVTDEELNLLEGDIWGLYIHEDHFYYYTKFQIFELVFDERNTSLLIWEHPDRLDPYSIGICGLMVHEDWFYIKDSGTTAIRYNPQSKLTEEFPCDFSSLVFVEDTCYYIDKANKTFAIYKLDQQTKGSVIVRGDGVNKKYGDSSEPHYDELRSIYGNLYYYNRDTDQFYRYDSNGKDVQFQNKAWILSSYIYPNLCYYIIDGVFVRIYEEDKFGNTRLILSVPKEAINFSSYNEYILVTDSAVFYKAGNDAPVQFTWKGAGKDG